MEPLGHLPRYDEPDIAAEIDIRGRFIKMACDLEGTILAIMTLATHDPDKDPTNFKGMTMTNKIEALIERLKTHKSHYFLEYEKHLEKLWEFKDIRNDFAHHKIRFENPADLRSFKVFFVDTYEGKEQLLYRDYTVDFVKEKISEYIELNAVFEGLNQKLYSDYSATRR